MLSCYGFSEEDSGVFIEAFGVVCGEEAALGSFRKCCFYLRMAVEVICKAGGHDISLGDDLDAGRDMPGDPIDKEGVVGAGEQDGVYLRGCSH